jgi:hypothetical protein
LSNRHALGACSADFTLAWEAIVLAIEGNDKPRLMSLLEQAGAWRRAMK